LAGEMRDYALSDEELAGYISEAGKLKK